MTPDAPRLRPAQRLASRNDARMHAREGPGRGCAPARHSEIREASRSASERGGGRPTDRGDMTSRFQGMRALAAGIAGGALAAFATVALAKEDLVGQPTDGAIDFQPAVTPLRH